MPDHVLTQRHLNRALLARQQLLERAPASRAIEDVLDQVGGLQVQYAPAGYVGLWTRLDGFRRDDLTRALEARRVVQATLMRGTIHLVSARAYWPYALGVRDARRAWAARVSVLPPEAELRRRADALARALGDGPRSVAGLGEVAAGFIGNLGFWVDLVRVPPSGTWERRRADRLALAADWIGPATASAADGRAHLVRTYLGAFGPATWRDIAGWAGLSVRRAEEAGATLELSRYTDERGRELVDLIGSELPDPDRPAPVRFLAHWDSSLLVHARRAGVLPEEHRARVFSSKNPFSVGTVLVNGRVAAAWSVRDARVVVDPYVPIGGRDREELEAERAALEAFHA